MDSSEFLYTAQLNGLRGKRFECPGCHMFGSGHEMEEHEKQRYHPDCLSRVMARTQEKVRAPVMYLVQTVPAAASVEEQAVVAA
ncbi:MAG: hypothetical protein WAV46_04545 [Candidatus Moraniibacteriota bacterium]